MPRAAAKPGEEGTPESVRDRLLNTARELFYREGARAVGVDTVVAQSGVAKTSLYRWFPSKDALIAAVLEQEAQDRWHGWDRTIERSDPAPREQLRAELAGIARFVSSPKYRGCPFMNVTAEFPDPEHPARKIATGVTVELRRRVRGLVDRMEDIRDREELTDQLVLLIDGAFSAAQCLGPDGPQKYLLSAGDALIEAQKR
ncbi:AcrR family transcriptional regulator [Povalibacter uvarum]|uniref:AcrR family transcriptional regulator n=1 Tax=Povalibacter uvarum TaxID=732238 RepID=A0A841HJ30_9GAMM|nr:TetR/AcrR family transcriptional regulator [Povalibacter uvarum]MBB6092594.1 AcrR family transcriptional regulator [Povalibacter uvarum]